jgi:hypothetical protein
MTSPLLLKMACDHLLLDQMPIAKLPHHIQQDLVLKMFHLEDHLVTDHLDHKRRQCEHAELLLKVVLPADLAQAKNWTFLPIQLNRLRQKQVIDYAETLIHQL